MEHINPLLELPSSNSYYMYGDDQYLDTQTSDSQSPINSTYDMPYSVRDFSLGDVYPSPDGEPDSPRSHRDASSSSTTSSASTDKAPAAKRKRENRYKNAPPSVLSRRRAQNRASQRAYRERKDQRIKDLEQMLNECKQRNDVLSQAYMELTAEYNKLKAQQLSDPVGAYPSAAELAAFDPTAAALGLSTFGYPELGPYAPL